MHVSRLTPTALALGVLSSASAADIVTVTLCADTIDVDPVTATIADLPGPDGEVSLSEALIATNNTPGHDTIEFRIPTSNWQLQFLYPGRAVLTSSGGFYWRALDEVTIDATTQTVFTGDTNPDGGEVVLFSGEFYVLAGGTVTGLDSTALTVVANTLVAGNTGSTNITVTGNGNTIRNNVGGTIKLDRGDSNVVTGNTVQRVRVWGLGSGDPALNNRIGGPAPSDRNFITGYGYWNSDGVPGGAAIELNGTRGTVIENNSIGTTPDGLAQGHLGCTIGISIDSWNADLAITGNRIAGVLGHGMFKWAGTLWGWAVYFWGDATNVDISGNTIGLDANNAPLLGSVWGVNVDNFASYTVASVDLSDNVIAGHLLAGLRVGPTATMRLSRNTFHDNGGLAIDLVGSNFVEGVTANDPLDADAGGNGLQNYPVIATAFNTGNAMRVTGNLASSASDAFTLEFFASPTCDPSGFGEAQTFLGSTNVLTDAGGNGGFDVTLAAAVPSGSYITATATLDSTGETSELSACVQAADPACQTDLGFGGPGSAVLTMCGGDLSSGTSADVRLASALPNRLAVLAIGPTFDPTPIFGGTIVPFPAAATFVYTTDGAGDVTVAGVPGGGGPFTVYIQMAYSDPALPHRWGISNALQVDFLP